MSDFLTNKTFMNIPLTIFTRKIPLYFFNCILDFVFFGMVIMVAFLMKYGKSPLCLTWFNSSNNDFSGQFQLCWV